MKKYQEALNRILDNDYDFPHDFYGEDKATTKERDADILQELIDRGNNSKTAREMFKELGYECDDSYDDCIYFTKYFQETKVNFQICFDLKIKQCELNADCDCKGLILSFDEKEHKAIHQQMKELGWLEQ
ncbi:hypothetical protein [[Clostridium] innocuum]|uniref:hypothetical protein n=1 Tax=Clostridium innocuum TaxID=1522 RepID=UPI001F575B0B|nr:hypothetical protein [[Clostridium] innocuum]MCI2978657.1 hypothetical protein [[Clostridium] innocuum]MCI3022532.1 hypothetical protein [[Clostridium] innocuum]MCI3022897.1 hypothetical protein [[Clostridium] innocuum]MCR0193824.1 hypothetical protein [[Clostridium] innocuum]MCR0280371.1 hypothetical protein [[Clostridium] innocuum]